MIEQGKGGSPLSSLFQNNSATQAAPLPTIQAPEFQAPSFQMPQSSQVLGSIAPQAYAPPAPTRYVPPGSNSTDQYVDFETHGGNIVQRPNPYYVAPQASPMVAAPIQPSRAQLMAQQINANAQLRGR